MYQKDVGERLLTAAFMQSAVVRRSKPAAASRLKKPAADHQLKKRSVTPALLRLQATWHVTKCCFIPRRFLRGATAPRWPDACSVALGAD